MTSSTNASSFHLPNDDTSSILISSPTSPYFDETARVDADYVLAMHDYSPQQQGATYLSFRAGQVIHVLNRDSSGWWDGELEGRRGWFPSNYVSTEVISVAEVDLPNMLVSEIFYQ
jgi:son of sevenless-like protein